MNIPALIPEPRDPFAVAVGNASLLGAGYLLLGRRRLAVTTGLVTLGLLAVLGTTVRTGWFEVVVLIWWAGLIGHGYLLARGQGPRAVLAGQWLAALAVTVPVLLTVTLVRSDAAAIGREVADARQGGDCAQALRALDRVWLGHRLADAPLAVRGERTGAACRTLRRAGDQLTTALGGDLGALRAGYDTLGSVLAEAPGHQAMVVAVLDGFLARLPTADLCETAAVTDWLRERPASRDVRDRSAAVVARTAPAALTGCGDARLAAKDWPAARDRYQQVLKRYPGDPHTARARAGLKQATLAIELANVRRLLRGSTGSRPEYCSTPARYSGAAPYRKGTNRALFFGNSKYTGKLPSGWRTTDPARAVLVVCAETEDYGTAVRTCPYENKTFREFPVQVTFHKIAIPVRVYELRTGKLVANRKVQINGRSCPRVLRYTTFLTSDFGPPSQVYVSASKARVRAGFRSLIVR
jgi:hypothetical protein